MLEALLLSWAIVVGVDLRVVAILAVVLWLPVIAAVVVASYVIRARPRPNPGAATFCHFIARELRSGLDLRSAMVGAAQNAGASHLASTLLAGQPMDQASLAACRAFPEMGEELAVVIGSVASTGAASADLFEEMGDVALSQLEMAQEVSTAVAPARASATILIGLPLTYLAYQVVHGNASQLFDQPAQRVLAAVGWVLVLSGVAFSAFIVRWAR